MKIPSGTIYYVIAIVLMFGPAILLFDLTQDDGIMTFFTSKGIGTLLFFLILISAVILYFSHGYKKSESKWKSGVFNGKQEFSEDALLQAYIRLGGLMLRLDTQDLKAKMVYMHRYFNQHFENSYTDDLTSALNASFHNPVQVRSVTPWLKANLRSISQRSQLVYFLAGLSAVDGSINHREKRFLKEVANELGITQKDFDSIMAMYTRFEDAFNNQQRQQRRAPSKSRSQYKREKAAKVLGVSVNASLDEIKKAYRSLAKVHHPDKFAGESESQQKIAEERFIQIQQAYELLLEFKN